jgi:hypothetical protein
MMKRSLLLSGVLSAVLVGSIGSSFLTPVEARAETRHEKVQPDQSPRELVEGVIFLQGAVGRRLIDNGALGSLSTSEKAEIFNLLEKWNGALLLDTSSQFWGAGLGQFSAVLGHLATVGDSHFDLCGDGTRVSTRHQRGATGPVSTSSAASRWACASRKHCVLHGSQLILACNERRTHPILAAATS